MKSKFILAGIILAAIFLLSYSYNNFFSKGMLVGQYVNRNYNYQPNLPEVPNVADTLTLLKNGQFESQYWGKGSYTISHTIAGTEIELIYDYEFGKAGYDTTVKRLDFGNPKIILDRDHDHYYEKLEQ
ncbi:MAG: hypothetical protein ACXVA2_21620 [Mucilaginibacter sp.]